MPVLNERDNIAALVTSVRAALTDIDWEILFVDDDSSDGTSQAVLEQAALDPRVRLILRVADPGLANSSIQGMLSTGAELLCVMDGDGQHDPAYLPRMVAMLEESGADLVSACRDLDSGAAGQALGARRTAISRTGNALIRMAIGRDARDPLSGFLMIRRPAFLRVVRKLSNSGFKLLFDILASDRTLRHVEMPFEFKARLHGQSKLNMLVVWQFALLLAEKLSRGWVPARLASFLVVGTMGLVVHLAVLYSLLGLGRDFTTSQSAAAIASVTFNFLFNNLLTFGDRRFRGWRLIQGWAAYMLICSVGLAANISISTWAFERLHLLTLPAALAGIAIDVMWKFVISDRIVWRRRKQAA